MAISYVHIRALWGAITVTEAFAQTPSYAVATDYASLGASAAPGSGIGVRRCTCVLSRSTATPADDDMNMHFDFLNITAGNPDDSWISADYATLEALLTTFFGAVASQMPSWARVVRYSWHRVGTGVVPPNPAVRILDLATPVVGSGTPKMPPQAACSITFRTGLRKHWGRTYLPIAPSTDAGGRIPSALYVTVNTAAQSLFVAARAADFMPVVVANSLESTLGIEYVETDDVCDIIRRRRWKHTVARSVLTA